ncbi:MAG: hypothetical protein ACRD3F_04915 [Acidobacteriaceae bacterium]
MKEQKSRLGDPLENIDPHAKIARWILSIGGAMGREEGAKGIPVCADKKTPRIRVKLDARGNLCRGLRRSGAWQQFDFAVEFALKHFRRFNQPAAQI